MHRFKKFLKNNPKKSVVIQLQELQVVQPHSQLIYQIIYY